MSTRAPLSIARLLSGQRGSSLSRLQREAAALAHLQARLRSALPAEFADRVQVGRIQGKTLILYVESPAWAARLRFLAPQLVKQLGKSGAVKPATIRVKVLPPAERPQPPRYRPRLSEGSRRLIEQTATGIGDEKLASALRRLARRRP